MQSKVFDLNKNKYLREIVSFHFFAKVIDTLHAFVQKSSLVEAFIDLNENKHVTWRSDLKFGLITKLLPETVSKDIENAFRDEICFIIHYSNRLILFLDAHLTQKYYIIRLEIHISRSISELIQFNNVTIITNSKKPVILVDKAGELTNKLTADFNYPKKTFIIHELIMQFLDNFEKASANHAKSDQNLYIYNLDLSYQILLSLELIHISNRQEIIFPPDNIYPKIYQSISKESLIKLKLYVNLTDANRTKINYFHLFVDILKKLLLKYNLDINIENIKNFLQIIIKRDFIHNFRDSSLVNPNRMLNGVLFRSATISRYVENINIIIDYLENNNIQSIIDLRTELEIQQYPYNQDKILQDISYYNIPWGPQIIDKSNEIVLKYIPLTSDFAFYEYALRSSIQISKIFNLLATVPKPILIHCHVGMDRTGIIIALVQFILGFSEIEIIRDYNNSHSYIRQEQGVINVVFKIITEFGGIYDYLKYIGVSNEYINQIKTRFSYKGVL